MKKIIWKAAAIGVILMEIMPAGLALAADSGSASSTTPAPTPVLSSVHPENIMTSGAQLRWQTDQPASSMADYGMASLNYTQFSSSRCDAGGYTTDHCVNLTGLVPGIAYVRARSMNTSGVEGRSVEINFTVTSSTSGTSGSTANTGSTASSMPTVKIMTNGGATGSVNLTAPASYTIYWTTTGNPTTCLPGGTWAGGGAKSLPAGSWDFAGVSVIGPKVYTLNCSNAYGTSSATVTINILASSTGSLLQQTSGGQATTMGTGTGTTNSSATTQAPPPSLMSVRAENAVGSSAQIRWQTDRPSSSLVDYGMGPGNYTQSAAARCDVGGLVTDHCVYLTGLATGAVYYRARSLDASGLEGKYSEQSFTAAGMTPLLQQASGGQAGQTSSTQVTPAAPQNLQVVPTGSSVTLSWVSATTVMSEIKIYRRGYASNSWVYTGSTDSAHTTYSENNLSPDTYQYQIMACASGLCSTPTQSYAVVIAPASPASTSGGTPTSTSVTNTSGSTTSGSDSTPSSATNPNTATSPTKVPEVTLSVNSSSVNSINLVAPAYYELAWSASNSATVCNPEGTWGASGTKSAPSGKWTFSGVTVLGQKTYTLACTNSIGTGRATVVVNILGAVPPAPSSTSTSSSARGTIPNSTTPNSSTTPSSTSSSTRTTLTTPSAPSSVLLATPGNSANVYIHWVDTSTNETSFRIERVPVSASAVYASLTAGANTTSYMDVSVPAGTYIYQVRACIPTVCSVSAASAPVTVSPVGNSNPGNSTSTMSANSTGSGSSSSGTANSTTNNNTSSSATSNTTPGNNGNTSALTVTQGGPAKVVTFGVLSASVPNALTLQWTATGAHGNAGMAANYVLKYSMTGPITETTWGDATPYTGSLPRPTPAGTRQQTVVTGLPNGKLVWFGLKTFNEIGEYSLSVSPSGAPYTAETTLPKPASATPTVPTGGSTPTTVSVQPAATTTGATVKSESAHPTADYPAPAVIGWGLATDKSGLSTLGVTFSVPVDAGSVIPDTILIYPKSGGVSSAFIPSVSPKANLSSISVVYRTPFVNNVPYVSLVRGTIQGVNGKTMRFDYVCEFPGLSPGEYLTSCPQAGGVSGKGSVVSDTAVPAKPAGKVLGKLTGSVTDPSGSGVSGAGVHAISVNSDAAYAADSRTDDNGVFQLTLPVGSYRVEVFPPSDRQDLQRPDSQQITVAEIPGGKAEFVLPAAVGQIAGKVRSSDGTPTADAEVGAYSEGSGQSISTQTDGQGNYQLSVSPGTWKVIPRPKDPNSAKWQAAGAPSVIMVANSADASVTVNFTVQPLSQKLSVSVSDQDGRPLPGAGVTLAPQSAANSNGSNNSPLEFRKSDASGQAVFYRLPGTYYLRASLAPGSGFVDPEEQTVALAAAKSSNAQIVFHRPAAITMIELKGKTRLSNGESVAAFVWAWSGKGRSEQTQSDPVGNFSFNLPLGDEWHVGASQQVGNFAYKSSEVTVVPDVTNASVSVDLVMTRTQNEPMPATVAVKDKATNQIVAEAADGARMVLPPSSATQSGNIELQVKPTTNAPSQASAKVVSTVYDITVKNDAGVAVTKLNDTAEIVLPYDPVELKAAGVTEDTLVPSYFDEQSGSWVKLDSYTIDKTRHVVIGRVKHLTRFALVAAADVTPPIGPDKVVAEPAGAGKVALAWANPTSDFRNAKIYRSAKKGEIGTVAYAEVLGSSQEDLGLVAGEYYYTVRAVDPAGNESVNENQVAVDVMTGDAANNTSVLTNPSVSFTRLLVIGSRGEDVKQLQVLLQADGVYPEGTVSGYFGNLTRAAVVRFQEKYANELLAPINLQSGTGKVGALTRAKLNKVNQAPANAESPAVSQ